MGIVARFSIVVWIGLASGATALGAPDLESRVTAADKRVARRFSSLALRAQKSKQLATARRLFERTLRLDPDNRIARAQLGFKRRTGSWERTSADAAAVDHQRDTDPERVEGYRKERIKLEEVRAAEVVKLCAKYGTPETARPFLLALLEVVPREKAVHVALGHEKIGERYVRPELAPMARALPQRIAAWAACAEPVDAYDNKTTLRLPKVADPKSVIRVGKRLVASGFDRGNTVFLARRTEAPSTLLRELLGADAALWDPSPVYFLSPTQYRDFIHSRHADAATRKRKLRFGTYRAKDCFAVRIKEFQFALDFYAHCIGFWSIEEFVSPAKPDGKRDLNAYSWLKEGTALLLSLELFDSAASWFSSRVESTAKAQPSAPMPDDRTRANCVEYIRQQLWDGTLPPMQEIWAASLNNLDRFKALQAWSFIRFMALYDPDGFRKLVPALRQAAEGSQLARTEGALEKAFGKPPAALVALWKAYLLELA